MEDIRKGMCPLCGHNEILEASPGVSVDAYRGIGSQVTAIQMTTETGPGIIEAFRTGLTGERPPRGYWNTFACRRCGYAQTFINHCDAVPIDDKLGTRLIKGPEPKGPYR